MIRTTILLLVFFPALALTEASAQEWARKMFDSVDHDFGNVARGTEAEHVFKITNIYQEPIEITSISSSCGCATPTVETRTIPSAQSIDLVTQFNTVAFKGKHTATITVKFAPPFAAEVRLQVHGFIRSDVVFQPSRVEFGSINATDGVEKVVTVSYAGRQDWQIMDVRSRNRNFEVELNEAQRGEGRVIYEMVVRLKKGAEAGYVNDRLTIVTNDPEHRLIPLSIEGRVTGSAISVSPSSLLLGTLRPGETVTKQLVVRGPEPFRIKEIRCNGEGECFEFVTNDASRKLHLVPVKFTAPDTPGMIEEEISIATDDDEEAAATIRVQAEVAAS